MIIQSIGDCLFSGTYNIHSQFEKVVNYSCGNNLLSFVEVEIGNSPVNIVVNNIDDLKQIVQISLSKQELICDSKIYALQNSTQYNSDIEEINFNENIILKNIKKLQSILVKHASPLSLAFVFDKSRENNFISSFEKNFLQKVKSAINKFDEGKIIEGIKLIRRCGFGLTPSGDDFIAGMLNALFLIEKISKQHNFATLRNEIYLTSKTENIISQNAIYFASKGRFNEVFKNLLFSLNDENDELLQQSAIKFLQSGESSGADTLSGFLFTVVAIQLSDSLIIL